MSVYILKGHGTYRGRMNFLLKKYLLFISSIGDFELISIMNYLYCISTLSIFACISILNTFL